MHSSIKSSYFFRLRFLAVICIIALILSTLLHREQPNPIVYARSSSQQEDPALSCEAGGKLFGEYKDSEALPLLEAGFIGRENGNFNDPADLGWCAWALGVLRLNINDSNGALEAHQVALGIFQRINNETGEISALEGMSSVYKYLGENLEALEYQKEALSIAYEIDDFSAEANGLNNLGLIHHNLDQYPEAIDAFTQAIGILDQLNDRKHKGTMIHNIGAVLFDQGLYDEALDYYQQALVIALEAGDPDGERDALISIGNLYHSMGNNYKSLDYLQQALQITDGTRYIKGQGTILNGMGNAYYSLGSYDMALDYLEQALVWRKAANNKTGERITLEIVGNIYSDKGRFAQALDYYQQAISIAQEFNDIEAEGKILNNIGLIYWKQGLRPDALNFFQKALTLAQKAEDHGMEGAILNNMGILYHDEGDYIAAFDTYQLALNILQEAKNSAAIGDVLHNLGSLYNDKGDYYLALDYYERALDIRHTANDIHDEGTTLSGIGVVYVNLEQYDDALNYHKRALDLLRKIGNRVSEAATLYDIGHIYHETDPDKALTYYEDSMDILEIIRTNSGSESGRAGFISKYMEVYNSAIELYHTQGQDELAFYTSERGRARAFLDSLSTGYIELSDKRSENLLAEMQGAQISLQTAKEALTAAEMSVPANSELIARLQTEIVQAERDYKVALNSIGGQEDQLNLLLTGRSNVGNLSEVQSTLDNNVTLISFWVDEKETFAFVISSGEIHVIKLSAPNSEISKWIENFRSFSSLNDSHSESLISLYKILFKPIKRYIKTSNLIIVPHGTLNYLPFAALTDGTHLLVEDYNISYLPSASSLPFIKQNTFDNTGQNFLILGNPSTGNTHATNFFAPLDNDLNPLPFAEQEAKNIANDLGIQPYLNENATETLVKQQASKTKILHLAAHGLFNPAVPLSSLIALAPDQENDGWLTVGEIYSLDLSNSDLVVLSACDTQLGELTAGDEFIGLTRAFLFAGAPTVIASLWNVDDHATALFMDRFYTHLAEGMGTAEALQKTQLDVRETYPHPYYWAAFVLSGDAGNNKLLIPTPAEPFAGKSSNIPCLSASLILMLFLLVFRRQ